MLGRCLYVEVAGDSFRPLQNNIFHLVYTVFPILKGECIKTSQYLDTIAEIRGDSLKQRLLKNLNWMTGSKLMIRDGRPAKTMSKHEWRVKLTDGHVECSRLQLPGFLDIQRQYIQTICLYTTSLTKDCSISDVSVDGFEKGRSFNEWEDLVSGPIANFMRHTTEMYKSMEFRIHNISTIRIFPTKDAKGSIARKGSHLDIGVNAESHEKLHFPDIAEYFYKSEKAAQLSKVKKAMGDIFEGNFQQHVNMANSTYGISMSSSMSDNLATNLVEHGFGDDCTDYLRKYIPSMLESAYEHLIYSFFDSFRFDIFKVPIHGDQKVWDKKVYIAFDATEKPSEHCLPACLYQKGSKVFFGHEAPIGAVLKRLWVMSLEHMGHGNKGIANNASMICWKGMLFMSWQRGLSQKLSSMPSSLKLVWDLTPGRDRQSKSQLEIPLSDMFTIASRHTRDQVFPQYLDTMEIPEIFLHEVVTTITKLTTKSSDRNAELPYGLPWRRDVSLDLQLSSFPHKYDIAMLIETIKRLASSAVPCPGENTVEHYTSFCEKHNKLMQSPGEREDTESINWKYFRNQYKVICISYNKDHQKKHQGATSCGPWSLRLVDSTLHLAVSDHNEQNGISFGFLNSCPLNICMRNIANQNRRPFDKSVIEPLASCISECLNVSLSASDVKFISMTHTEESDGISNSLERYFCDNKRVLSKFTDSLKILATETKSFETKYQSLKQVHIVCLGDGDTSGSGIFFNDGILRYVWPFQASASAPWLLPTSSMLFSALSSTVASQLKFSSSLLQKAFPEECMIPSEDMRSILFIAAGRKNRFRIVVKNILGEKLKQSNMNIQRDVKIQVLSTEKQKKLANVQSNYQCKFSPNGTALIEWTAAMTREPAKATKIKCCVSVQIDGVEIKGSPFPSVIMSEDKGVQQSLSKGRLMGIAKASVEAGNDIYLSLSHDSETNTTMEELQTSIHLKLVSDSSSTSTTNPRKYIKYKLHSRSVWFGEQHDTSEIYRQGKIALISSHKYSDKSHLLKRPHKLQISKTSWGRKHRRVLVKLRAKTVGEYSIKAICRCGEPLQIVSTTSRLRENTVEVVVIPSDLNIRNSFNSLDTGESYNTNSYILLSNVLLHFLNYTHLICILSITIILLQLIWSPLLGKSIESYCNYVTNLRM